MSFGRQEDRNAEEAPQARRDRREATSVDVMVSQGQSVVDAIRSIGVTEVSCYRWRREFGGLKTDRMRRMKERADGSCIRLRAERPNHVRSYDFVEDRTHDGRKYRMLDIIDGFTREGLAKRVEHRQRTRPRPIEGAICAAPRRNPGQSSHRARPATTFRNC